MGQIKTPPSAFVQGPMAGKTQWNCGEVTMSVAYMLHMMGFVCWSVLSVAVEADDAVKGVDMGEVFPCVHLTASFTDTAT